MKISLKPSRSFINLALGGKKGEKERYEFLLNKDARGILMTPAEKKEYEKLKEDYLSLAISRVVREGCSGL